MKLLHTADWHVGKGLQGRNRSDEHEAVLAEIAGIARTEQVDLIAVAGDLFDAASPTPEAERIVYAAMLELSSIAPVIVIPGNHDSDSRLGAVKELWSLANVTLRPFVDPSPVELEFGAEKVRVATLPWISQRYIVKAEQLMAKDAADLTGDFRARMKRVIDLICEGFETGSVNVLVGHVTISGALLGGGERTAQTIFDYWIDAGAFPSDVHYVGLGHIHKTQKMPGLAPIHYSGSPLALDFSDKEEDKNVLIVDATPTTPAVVTSVPLKSGRRLRTVRGTLTDLSQLADKVGEDYLRVFVQEPARSGLGEAVREILPNAVKVIVESDLEARATTDRLERAGTSPQELFTEYLLEQGIEDDALVGLFTELYEEAS